ncbi:unnamed protein product [Amoebophrya sp. A25]|nr:unnamed protein product [Amoebophrya sp. A25]|eukprot:GSA25T00025762001.1
MRRNQEKLRRSGMMGSKKVPSYVGELNSEDRATLSTIILSAIPGSDAWLLHLRRLMHSSYRQTEATLINSSARLQKKKAVEAA